MSDSKPLFFSDSEEDAGTVRHDEAGPSKPATRQMNPPESLDSDEDLVVIADRSTHTLNPQKRKKEPKAKKQRIEPPSKKVKPTAAARNETANPMKSKSSLARPTSVDSPWEYKVRGSSRESIESHGSDAGVVPG